MSIPTNQDKRDILLRNALPPHYDTLHADGLRDDLPEGKDAIVLGSGDFWYVAKSGNDTNAGTPEAPFLTINKAVSVAGIGDTVVVRAGTYSESTVDNPHVTQVTWLDTIRTAVSVRVSGNINNRCTIMAHPEDVGSVILDGADTLFGLHANNHSYWNVWGMRFENCIEGGIGSWGQVPNHVPNFDILARGWKVSNCVVDGVYGADGRNVSGIAAWGTQDWHIVNCSINDVTVEGSNLGSGIQSYGMINGLIENIRVTNCGYGVFLKDHFLTSIDPRTRAAGNEIRYCIFDVTSSPFNIGIRGSGSAEAGDNYFHHNICYGFTAGETFITAIMGGAEGQSGSLRLEHNVFDMTGDPTNVTGIDVQAIDSLRLRGNIFCGSYSPAIVLRDVNSPKITRLTESDYNIFTAPGTFAIVDRFGSAPNVTYSTFANWQAALASGSESLAIDNPDANSLLVADIGTVFENRAERDYTHKAESPSLGFMPDDSNAGPFQTGSEVIGLLSSFGAV
jgi:hypothetical protein